MAYASYTDVQTRMGVVFTETEQSVCTSLLSRAALMIDSLSAAADKSADIKKEVSVNMTSRAMSNNTADIPQGATQGSMSGLGYSQSWTIGSGGAVGDLYFSKDDRRLLGVGNQIGSYSPVQELVPAEVIP